MIFLRYKFQMILFFKMHLLVFDSKRLIILYYIYIFLILPFKLFQSIKCLFCNNITKHIKQKFQNPDVRKIQLNLNNSFDKTPHKSNSKQKLKKRLISCIDKMNNSKSISPNVMPAKSVTPNVNSSSTIKKKKKRDKFAGLNKMACLAATPKSENPLMLLMKRTK